MDREILIRYTLIITLIILVLATTIYAINSIASPLVTSKPRTAYFISMILLLTDMMFFILIFNIVVKGRI